MGQQQRVEIFLIFLKIKKRLQKENISVQTVEFLTVKS